jgi:hypothetical protein
LGAHERWRRHDQLLYIAAHPLLSFFVEDKPPLMKSVTWEQVEVLSPLARRLLYVDSSARGRIMILMLSTPISLARLSPLGPIRRFP